MNPRADSDLKNGLVRAFVAVSVPEPASSELERYLDSLRPLAGLRWVTRAQLHITLRFLGELRPETLEQVKDRLASLRFEPFEVGLSCAGAFPAMSCPRVLWLSGKRGKKKLFAMAEAVDEAVAAAGLARERRAFKPHLTIARTNGTPLPPALMRALENTPMLAWRCESFDLMRSRLTPQGAVYTKIPLA